jgi:hypothetical protein
MNNLAKLALSTVKEIQTSLPNTGLPSSEGIILLGGSIIPYSAVKGTRGYIEKVVHQINGCYEYGCYDACAVMMRRLIETLIIELFVSQKIESKIKDSNNDFFHLGELVKKTESEISFNLTRNTKRALGKLKDIGDLSAHNPYYNAHREYIDERKTDFRTVVHELMYKSGIKK